MNSIYAFLTETTIAHHPLWLWLLFAAVVILILVLDLGVLEKKSRELSALKSSLLFTLYVSIASLFGVWIWYYFGAIHGQAFFTTYLIELGLSVDNVLMMSLIFIYLDIPTKYQHRVLIWGVLGAFVLRGAMILLGAEIIEKYSYLLFIFGIFLIYSGIKVIIDSGSESKPSESKVYVFFKRLFRVSETLEDNKFFVRKPDPKQPNKQILYVTPLFLALLLIEFGDVVFAVDSIPAVFSVTHDAYIIFTSNLFAVLGLRAFYFILLEADKRFYYMRHATAIILIIAGIKVFTDVFVGQIPDLLSLGITFALLFGGIAASMIKTRKRISQKI